MASTITLLRALPDEDDLAADSAQVGEGRRTELRHPGDPARDRALEALATWMTARVPTDGHVSERAPDLCLHRYAQPTTFRKVPAFGVTLGVVLQGEKRLRIANRDLVVDP